MCAYASASDVSGLCRNLLGAASGFDTSTSPTLTQVNTWLSSGCALINSIVGGRGFSAIPQSSVAYEFAMQANAQFAAWMAERSRTLATVQVTERTRADMFKRDFNDSLDLLKVIDLGRLGVIQTSAVYTGGISNADKNSVESDTDRVTPRFTRGMLHDESIPQEGDFGALGGDPQARTT